MKIFIEKLVFPIIFLLFLMLLIVFTIFENLTQNWRTFDSNILSRGKVDLFQTLGGPAQPQNPTLINANILPIAN